MPVSGPTFTDWAQLELYSERPLLVDEDFSWSEPLPRRSSRRYLGTRTSHRHEERVVARASYRDQPTPGTERGGGSATLTGSEESVPDSAWSGWPGGNPALDTDAAQFAGHATALDRILQADSRHTVVIGGHGDQRYSLAHRRRSDAGLPFHQRVGFNPDRTAMWAVLLCIALLLGCIAH